MRGNICAGIYMRNRKRENNLIKVLMNKLKYDRDPNNFERKENEKGE